MSQVGGAEDGNNLYQEGQEPCLVCGRIVNMDWDGVLVWHYQGPASLFAWCPGSRTSFEEAWS